MSIPVIDLFAGPGGLNEGFSSEINGEYYFKTALSIEKTADAHSTLSLRAFFRHFLHEGLEVPKEYYSYLAGKITRDDLFKKFPEAAKTAEKEAMLAKLGSAETSNEDFDRRIIEVLNNEANWLLIGGPPCQAYSLVGRARQIGALKDKTGKIIDEAKEFFSNEKHTLYKEYLRIIAVHAPVVFVMENVKGILSAKSKLNGENIFPKILSDLKKPYKVADEYKWNNCKKNDYHIISFVTGNVPEDYKDYLIKTELYGIPQARHRVILLGIRSDFWENIKHEISPLKPAERQITVRNIINDIIPLRSGFSKRHDNDKEWLKFLSKAKEQQWFDLLSKDLKKVIVDSNKLRKAGKELKRKSVVNYIPTDSLNGWYSDSNLQFLPNHETRTHMDSDLYRYLFVSAYGLAYGESPRLRNFPEKLLPNHKNIILENDEKELQKKEQKFADRFKVQRWDKPASTITCHISKDGHYFIHPDPVQCRSLTVREAARLQTFPDNYFFEGNRTQQYHQVGNAVPPYLAKLLAEIVYDIFNRALDK